MTTDCRERSRQSSTGAALKRNRHSPHGGQRRAATACGTRRGRGVRVGPRHHLGRPPHKSATRLRHRRRGIAYEAEGGSFDDSGAHGGTPVPEDLNGSAIGTGSRSTTPALTPRAAARCRKQLRKDRPDLWTVVTYADLSQGHEGIVYRATNAVVTGVIGKGNAISQIVPGSYRPRSRYPARRERRHEARRRG